MEKRNKLLELERQITELRNDCFKDYLKFSDRFYLLTEKYYKLEHFNTKIKNVCKFLLAWIIVSMLIKVIIYGL